MSICENINYVVIEDCEKDINCIVEVSRRHFVRGAFS